MKVCFIAGTLGRGGAERQLVYMLQALKNEGVEARVLSLTTGEVYEKEIKNMGIEVGWMGASGNRAVRLMRIVADIRKRPADILHSTHFFANIYAGAAGRILGIPSIGAIRSDMALEFETNKIYGKWQLKIPSHLICNSTVAMDRAVSRGVRPEKIDVLKNVVDTNTNGNSCLRKPSGTVRILFVGRLSEEKRPGLFIDLASRLLGALPECRLRFEVAGDGPLRTELEIRAAKGGFSKDVFSFLGAQNQMGPIYCQSDIVVLTSVHEGSPNVVLEALAHGIPVVATKVGGVPEVLNEECGILVDPSDLDAMCAATSKLIRDRELRFRMGRNGQQYVANTHSPAQLHERLTGIYSKVARRGYVNA